MQPIQITHSVPIYWCSLNKIMNVNPVRRLSLLLSIIFIVINRVEYTWCLIPPHVVVNTGCRTQSSTLNVHFEFLSTIFQLSSYCFYRYFFVLRTYRNMCVCVRTVFMSYLRRTLMLIWQLKRFHIFIAVWMTKYDQPVSWLLPVTSQCIKYKY